MLYHLSYRKAVSARCFTIDYSFDTCVRGFPTLEKRTEKSVVFFLEGLPSSNKTSSYPVRMENGVPVVQQNQSTQPLQIQPSMLTQVRHKAHCLWNGGIISNADVPSLQSDKLQFNPVELERKRQSLNLHGQLFGCWQVPLNGTWNHSLVPLTWVWPFV